MLPPMVKRIDPLRSFGLAARRPGSRSLGPYAPIFFCMPDHLLSDDMNLRV